jgi:phosphatidate phosphatase APP1
MERGGSHWVVISDIDETIKASSTISAIHYIRYLLVGRPICGMPEVFRYMVTKLSPKFFYLSAAPSILRHLFTSFISSYYPTGYIFLAPLSISALWLINCKDTLVNYKWNRIDSIIRSQTNCKVICIGDNSQEDLKAHIRADKAHASCIQKIFIRETGVRQCRNMPTDVIVQQKVEFFTTAQELRSQIESLITGRR